MNGLSYTSNTIKLLKHMDNLRNLQKGKATPIMVHIGLTNRCNLNCEHCCFKDRDKSLELPFDVLKSALNSFRKVGAKAIEYTGAAEPTLYPYVNEAINHAHDLGFKLGFITNGIELNLVDQWHKLEWVRISLNGIDYGKKDKIKPDIIQGATKTACYIWNKHSENNIEEVIEFANFYKLPTRIAPDCIQSLDKIEQDTKYIINRIKGLKNEHAFVSDFNIETTRRNDNCYIHAIKPYFFVDGNVYSCPSAELAIENGKNVNEKFLLCKYDEIEEFYSKPFEKKVHTCSYCKYSLQNSLLEDILAETKHNEFA